MPNDRRAAPGWARPDNRKGILNLLRTGQTVTKQALADTLGLSHTTVNACIDVLMAEGLVEAAGLGLSGGGRKPVLLRLVRDAHAFFGVHVSPDRVYVLCVDMLGEETDRRELGFLVGEPFSRTLDAVAAAIAEMANARSLPRERIGGVGMTFPGVVDGGRLRVRYAPNVGLRDTELAPFGQRLGLELAIENEAVAAAMAERWDSPPDDGRNMVYLSVAEGIGACILIGGEAYRGSRYNAGEFGHVKVTEHGLPCNCGRSGCWELYASKTALLRYAREQQTACTTDELWQRFSAREPSAVRAVDAYARSLFRGIEMVLLALGPDEVVVGGDLGGFMDDILRYGRDTLRLTDAFYGYRHTLLRASAAAENGAIRGAALLPLLPWYRQGGAT